jgi:hypothetical protein
VELNIGDWVLVNYEKNLYPGEVKTLCSENVTVNIMVSAKRGKCKWPFPKDIHNYAKTDIKRKILQPIPCDNHPSQFYFPNI